MSPTNIFKTPRPGCCAFFLELLKLSNSNIREGSHIADVVVTANKYDKTQKKTKYIFIYVMKIEFRMII